MPLDKSSPNERPIVEAPVSIQPTLTGRATVANGNSENAKPNVNTKHLSKRETPSLGKVESKSSTFTTTAAPTDEKQRKTRDTADHHNVRLDNAKNHGSREHPNYSQQDQQSQQRQQNDAKEENQRKEGNSFEHRRPSRSTVDGVPPAGHETKDPSTEKDAKPKSTSNSQKH